MLRYNFVLLRAYILFKKLFKKNYYKKFPKTFLSQKYFFPETII